ncbi:phenylalanyl-tRNA synthetase beta chain [Bacilli bacterium PM5-3]|nr:phenylalanyl-tRNA synthetase beta chain [Bacilli bacterium PM5-3]MDH6602920.1 phenylalanyl-tRNA synthetase beta chain [Bacilli bacterium PM5-9]
MIVSYNTLKKYVDLSEVSPYELGDLLTNAGLEVEQVYPFAQGSDLVIGYIKEAKRHPESDHLSVCQVDVKDEVLQICCGAPNVQEGKYVIVAKPGCELEHAKVPVIKKVEFAGVESNGMMCSLSELGIAEKFQNQDQLQGIEILDGEYEIGAEALSTLGFDDYVLDIALTPNRSDIYSIYALAIEVAGLLKQKVKEVEMNVDTTKPSKYNITIEHEDCRAYCLYDFNNIVSMQSSEAIKNELMVLGFKPRFNIVDTGNIAMVISGNPVHTFDADKLKSNEFVIKKGLEMDDFLALDGKTYKIEKDDLLITNAGEIVAIAGVIGSKSSCIDEETTNVVVETADFNHVSVRNTARRLDLFSEASTRFSKITNPYTLEFPVRFFMDSLNLECDGAVRVGMQEYHAKEITLTHQKIEKVLGIKISLESCIEILENLSFKVKQDNETISVYPPSYRKDVEVDVDVIEEIIRVYGYDNIVSTLPLQEIVYNKFTPLQEMVRQSKNIFSGLGLKEIVTYQLNSKDKLDVFSDEESYKELLNPLSEERKYFRNQLLSNMVETIQYNKAYQHNDLALFEISDVCIDNVEQRRLSIGLSGLFENNAWQRQIKKADFYLLKGIIFEWLEKLGFYYGRVLIKPIESDHKYFHPTRSAYLTINNKVFGVFGQIHPGVAKNLKLKDTLLAEIDIEMLSENVGRINKYEGINLLPSVTRDLSLVVPNSVDAAKITKLAKTGNNKLVKDVKIFDVYYGEGLPEDHYSISISLLISDDKKTLTDEIVNEIIDNILDAFNKKLNITLRG